MHPQTYSTACRLVLVPLTVDEVPPNLTSESVERQFFKPYERLWEAAPFQTLEMVHPAWPLFHMSV